MPRSTLAMMIFALAATPAAGQPAPVADHHQHLFSPAIEELQRSPTSTLKALTANEVVALLDSAGIRRAAVLSVAYMFGSANRTVENEYEKVRAENDWTGAQVAQHPGRLVGFCSFNPLRDYALAELERCAKDPNLRHGIKLHFGNSDVQLDDTAHVAQLRRVFGAANARRMAIVVHARASISRRRPYGARQSQLFIEQLLPMAPDVTVQVAHLAGTGPGYEDPPADSAMAAFAAAIRRRDPRTRRLLFDVASIANRDISLLSAKRLARRLREVGLDRIVYGTDAATGDNLRPRASWKAFRELPLTEAEFAQVARNVAPYLR